MPGAQCMWQAPLRGLDSLDHNANPGHSLVRMPIACSHKAQGVMAVLRWGGGAQAGGDCKKGRWQSSGAGGSKAATSVPSNAPWTRPTARQRCR